MYANEQALEIQDILDKASSGSAPGFEDFQYSYALSQAQDEFIKDKYNYKSNVLNEGFEQSEKRRKDLAQLVKTGVIYAQDINNKDFFRGVSNQPNGSFWILPEDCLWAIQEYVFWNTTGCYLDKRIKVKPVTHDEFNILVENEFTKPYEQLVFRLDHSSEFSINDTNYFRLKVNPFYPVTNGDYILDIDSISEGSFTLTYSASSNTWLEVLTYFSTEINTNYPLLTAELNVGNLKLDVKGSTGETVTVTITDPSTGGLVQDNLVYPVHELVTHGWDIKEYHIRYIKQPKDIVVDLEDPTNQVHCELNTSTHREINKIAAKNMLASLEDPRYQAIAQQAATDE